MCGFQGSRTEERSRIGENTDGEAMNMCEALFHRTVTLVVLPVNGGRVEGKETGPKDGNWSQTMRENTHSNDRSPILLLELSEPAAIHHPGDHLSHIEWSSQISTHDSMEVTCWI